MGERNAIFVRDSTSIWCRMDDVLLVVTRPGPTEPRHFAALIGALRDPEVHRILGISFGDSETTSEERRQIGGALQGKKTVALTESVLVRGLITALGWLGAPVRAFAHHDLAKALDELEYPVSPDRVLHEARALMLESGWTQLAERLPKA